MEELKYKVGDKFRVVEERADFKIGEIVKIIEIDSNCSGFPYLLDYDIPGSATTSLWLNKDLKYWNVDEHGPMVEPINDTSNTLIQIL